MSKVIFSSKPARKGGKAGFVPADQQDGEVVSTTIEEARRYYSNPLHWKRDPDIDFGIKGLGGSRMGSKGYLQGKVITQACAVWRESPREQVRAEKAAEKAAKDQKAASSL